MNKKVISTAIVGMMGLGLVGSYVTYAAEPVSQQGFGQELPIRNGDFNSGLDHWIVSNPGMSNPKLITENGKSYVRATNGENIHQYLNLKPNTTYTFTYEVAGSTAFPAKVEFGTANDGEAFKVLKESAHDNESWEQKTFNFTTPAEQNRYIIRFGSTGNGWADFDSINVAPEHQNKLVSVGVQDYNPYIYLHLTPEQYNTGSYIIYLDGSYYYSVYKGMNYYSYKTVTDDAVTVRRGFSGKKGQKIDVYEECLTPGEKFKQRTLVESKVLDHDLVSELPNLPNAVREITTTLNKLYLTFDKTVYEGKNNIYITVNGEYVGSVYNNACYYYYVTKRTADTVKIERNLQLKKGDIVEVTLSGGVPGASSGATKTLMTYVVE